MNERLRSLPSVDRLVSQSEALLDRYPRDEVVLTLQTVTRELRARLLAGSQEKFDAEALVAEAGRQLEVMRRPGLHPVINATGVVLHTNMGRAPIAASALERAIKASQGYCNLELDLPSGQRGSRYTQLSRLLRRLTGAEAGLVVNNCAAAMLLIVAGLAGGKEVVVSRGELVEIGGSFRVPDVLAQGGARLVEVGTTNKTRLGDFAQAIGPETAMLLSTHASNFRLVGFTESVPPAELTALARERGVISCLDIGSGLMQPMPGDEPTVPAMVAAGFDLVAFSGDKLLGGPQAGLVVGRADLIERLKRHPLTRALRVDKLVLSALEATLQLHLDPAVGRWEVPVLRMLTMPMEELARRGRVLKKELGELLGDQAQVEAVEGTSSVGGGTLPGHELPTWLVRVEPLHASEEVWARKLRTGDPAALVRRQEGALLIDPRTMTGADMRLLVEAFGRLL